MYGFWAIVLFGGILRNLYNTFWHARADRQKQAHHEGESAPLDISVLSNTWRLFRQHVTLPPVLGDRHRRLLFGFFVPTRIEGFIVYSFWIVSLVLCAVTYNTFEGNM
jgi:ferric-chelate reductase